ncbi:MAG: hypothetical protein ACREJ3_04160, partial [Polyangiaceae bacterium]
CDLDAGGAAPIRGALMVGAGVLRLDLELHGDSDRCIADAHPEKLPGDAAPTFLSYTASSDGLTVDVALGGTTCPASASGEAGTTTDVGVFVRRP